MENPIKMDDLGGNTTIFGSTPNLKNHWLTQFWLQISSRLVDDTQLIRDLFGTQLHNLGGVKKWRHARGLLQQKKYSSNRIHKVSQINS